MIRIAVDAMGGDLAPAAIVDGAVAAARHLDVRIALVGPTAVLHQALALTPDWRDLAIDIVDAPDVVAMNESPGAALRRKPRASIRVAADLVARREAAALFSAGHTGATVMAAHAAFGMIPGVDRPALATTIPTRRGSAVLLDAGANVECRPQHLLQFGVMGTVYARLALGVARPRVGLLSIGEEETKGNELTREAHRLLKAAPTELHRQRRGARNLQRRRRRDRLRRLHRQRRAEDERGAGRRGGGAARRRAAGHVLGQMGYLLSRRAFRRFRRRVDYSEYGGAPLLGVAGLAIVGHGRSSAKAVRNAIAMASHSGGGEFVHSRRRGNRQDGGGARDRVHLPGTGFAAGRHGQGAGRGLS